MSVSPGRRSGKHSKKQLFRLKESGPSNVTIEQQDDRDYAEAARSKSVQNIQSTIDEELASLSI